MESLKIEVNSINAGEAIDLLVNLGHKPLSTKRGLMSEVEQGSTHIVNTGNGLFTTKHHYNVKEITLPELRAMVNPMKEWLNTKTYEYKQAACMFGHSEWIEIPEGENVAYKDNDSGDVYFTRLEMGYRDVDVIWKRATHPEELPFIDDEPKSFAEIEKVRQQTIEQTLAERQAQYGCFEDVAFVTENIMSILAQVRVNGLNDLPHTHRMALYMIASKMARIVNGDFNSIDGWHDIAGYAKLVEDTI